MERTIHNNTVTLVRWHLSYWKYEITSDIYICCLSILTRWLNAMVFLFTSGSTLLIEAHAVTRQQTTFVKWSELHWKKNQCNWLHCYPHLLTGYWPVSVNTKLASVHWVKLSAKLWKSANCDQKLSSDGEQDTSSHQSLSYSLRRQVISNYGIDYRQTSNIRRTLIGNKFVDHSDVVGASPVGAAPTTS